MSLFPPDATRCFQPDTIGDEFELFTLPESFNNAVKLCSDRGSTLARVSSQEEYDLVKKLLDNTSPNAAQNSAGSRVWLGIHDRDDVTGPGNTDFSFIDGFQNTSFFAQAGEFPWASGEPNDVSQLNDNQKSNCVDWRLDKNQRHLWGDDICSLPRLFLCRKKGSCLIVQPTSAPTESPTLSPTAAPTIPQTLSTGTESLSPFKAVLLTLIVGSTLGILILLGIIRRETKEVKVLIKRREKLVEETELYYGKGDAFDQYL